MVGGWAATENDRILVDTIHRTPRAAKVNWLVTRPKVMVYHSHTDEQINDMFAHYQRLSTGNDVKLAIQQVEVRLVGDT